MMFVYLLQYVFQNQKKCVHTCHKGQSRGITKVAFVDRWLLFGASETTYPIFRGHIKTGLYGQETTTRMCSYTQV